MLDLSALPYSEACERNKGVILEVLKAHLTAASNILEIGSGTGQHAEYFASNLPHLHWQTTDQPEYLPGIEARILQANLPNLLSPFQLNVNQTNWFISAPQTRHYDAVFTANTFHIMGWSDVQSFFSGLSTIQNDCLIVYGPFKYQGEFTSQSNQQFDAMLRQRNPNSGIRDFEQVNQLAVEQGFQLQEDKAMPANNQCIIWSR